jgi:PilZ domain-containing protein
VESTERGVVKGMVRDIALDSIYIYTLPAFKIDEQVKLEITLLGAESQLTIKVPAKVIRKDADGVALRFINNLEWWPIFTFFPLHCLDNDTIPASNLLEQIQDC